MENKILTHQVESELKYDPEVDAAHIGVSVDKGAVTLTGKVSTYAEKRAAIEAAERVYGVQGVADRIDVHIPSSYARDDSDIAADVQHALQANLNTPESVKGEVRDGHVWLRGTADWHYQCKSAENAVRYLKGVKGVTNFIEVKPKVKYSEVKQRITEALQRNANLDARRIWVTTDNGTVHLHGHVHSIQERQAAEHAAYGAPGVVSVEDEITVSP